MHNYKELNIWKEARSLVKEVYLLSSKFPKEELYGLTSQIRRAVISVPSNIAEGTGRNSNKEFIRFLDFAIGSLFEVETQLILAKDLEFISTDDFENISIKIKSIIKMIIKFRGVLKI